MIFAYIVLVLLSIIMHAENKKTDNSGYSLIGITLSIIATIIIVIILCTKDSNAVGGYAYYVNGIKVSSGFSIFTENFALTLIMGVVNIFIPIGIGSIIGKKLPKRFIGSKLSLVMFIILLILGIMFIYAGVTGLIHTSNKLLISNIVSIVFGVAVSLLSVFGIIKYKKEKK